MRDIGGSGVESAGYTLYYGLGVARPIIANPTNEQYKEITGRDLPFELNWGGLDKDNQGEEHFRIWILCENQETGNYDFVKFYLYGSQETTQSGRRLFMNELGSFVYSDSEETIRNNPNITKWFGTGEYYPAYRGINQLYSFLQALIKYSDKSAEAQWMHDMVDCKCTQEYLFERQDVSGLNELLKWANNRDYAVTCMYGLRETTKDGRTYLNQTIETGKSYANLFFKTQLIGAEHVVSDYTLEQVQKLEDKLKESGLTFSSNLYVIGRMQKYVDKSMPSEEEVGSVDPSKMQGVTEGAV